MPKSQRNKPLGKKTTKRKPFSLNLSSDRVSGRVLSIDPSLGHLGWAIHDVEKDKDGININLKEFGTIATKESNIKGADETITALQKIYNIAKPDYLVIEDYEFIRGKTRGMYVVPGMIMLVQYIWYRFSGEEAYKVPAPVWKRDVIGSGAADKAMIKEILQRMLEPEIVREITSRYAKIRGSKVSDCGEQDCYDAIGIGLYFSRQLIENYKNQEMFI